MGSEASVWIADADSYWDKPQSHISFPKTTEDSTKRGHKLQSIPNSRSLFGYNALLARLLNKNQTHYLVIFWTQLFSSNKPAVVPPFPHKPLSFAVAVAVAASVAAVGECLGTRGVAKPPPH